MGRCWWVGLEESALPVVFVPVKVNQIVTLLSHARLYAYHALIYAGFAQTSLDVAKLGLVLSLDGRD